MSPEYAQRKAKKIAKEIEAIKAQMDDLRDRKLTLQSKCPHPDADKDKVAKASTGNWCPADDSYWYEFKCIYCGRFWVEDQDAYNKRMRGR